MSDEKQPITPRSPKEPNRPRKLLDQVRDKKPTYATGCGLHCLRESANVLLEAEPDMVASACSETSDFVHGLRAD